MISLNSMLLDFDLGDIKSMSYLKEKELFPNLILFEKEFTTSLETNINSPQNNINVTNDGIFLLEEILKILITHNKFHFENIFNNFQKEQIEKVEQEFRMKINKKINDKKYKKRERKILDNKIVFNRGRKKANDFSRREHNKFTADNIIKKIKAKLFKYVIIFCNNILKEENINITLKNINYNNVNKICKKTEIEQFDMPLKELISKEISPKYTSLDADYNKKRITQILTERKDNEILNTYLI